MRVDPGSSPGSIFLSPEINFLAISGENLALAVGTFADQDVNSDIVSSFFREHKFLKVVVIGFDHRDPNSLSVMPLNNRMFYFRKKLCGFFKK